MVVEQATSQRSWQELGSLLDRLIIIGLGNPNRIPRSNMKVYQYRTTQDIVADVYNDSMQKAVTLSPLELSLPNPPSNPLGWHDVLVYVELLKLDR